MWLAKAWTAIDSLSIVWKSNLFDKIKRNFFQKVVESIQLIWMHLMEKGLTGIAQNATSNAEQIMKATSHKTAAVRPPTTNL